MPGFGMPISTDACTSDVLRTTGVRQCTRVYSIPYMGASRHGQGEHLPSRPTLEMLKRVFAANVL